MKKISEKIIKGGSNRGLTFSDVNLKESGMGIGEHFKVLIDKENKKVILETSKEGMTVSRKKSGSDYKPLVDIRSKEVVEQFKESDKLLVEFFDGGRVIIKSLREGETAKKTIETKVPEGFFDGIIKPSTGNFSMDIQLFSALKSLRVISFFSGAGMLDSALGKGYEIVFANDIDKGAVETYKKNIGEHIVLGDIKEIEKRELPAADVLVAGFPCVAFSNVNRSQTRGENHEAAFLYREILETAKVKKSLKVIMVENVPEFITACEGELFKEYKEELEKLGFELSHKVVDDKGYGGYSSRKRVLIVASKIGLVKFPEPKFSDDNYKTVGEAFQKNIKKNSPNLEDFSVARADTLERMKYVPQGGNWKDIPEHMRSKGKFHNYFRRLSLDGQSPTLVNWRKSVILSPTEDRILSIREAAAIMGLPWNYEFFGTLNEKQQQVANGVTRAIGSLISSMIQRIFKRNNLEILKRKNIGTINTLVATTV